MPELQYFTVGFVPPNHTGRRIYCGDPDCSKTLEITFIADAGMIYCIDDKSFKLDASDADWFSPKSMIWKTLASKINGQLKVDPPINSYTLASVWASIMDEPFNNMQLRQIESDLGEFMNKDKVLNSHYFFRYQVISNDDVSVDNIYTAAPQS